VSNSKCDSKVGKGREKEEREGKKTLKPGEKPGAEENSSGKKD
jgi:hypothetical protein